MIEALIDILSSTVFLLVWLITMVASLIILLIDLRNNNALLMPLMKAVWVLTVVYSGVIGLVVYIYSGRKEIPEDNLFRKGFRSVAHCYSGCGGGEIAGILIAAGLLNLDTMPVAVITFMLAYVAGFTLTVGPLMQAGVPFDKALKDAFYTETASITVMEVTAISVDLYLAGEAAVDDLLFWTSLIFSLSCGLLAAYPVNLLLIHWGVKEGMHNPKMMHHHSH